MTRLLLSPFYYACSKISHADTSVRNRIRYLDFRIIFPKYIGNHTIDFLFDQFFVSDGMVFPLFCSEVFGGVHCFGGW